MSATTVSAPAPRQSLDDVMLAMDIVDTLRHRELALEKELGGAARKDALVARLKEIYAAQGIEVPDRILEDGVKALDEQRFVYAPPKDSVAVRLARFYIGRDRWMKPVAFILGTAIFVTAAYEFGFDNPREARAERAHVELTVELPKDLAAARDAAVALAGSEQAKARIDAAYRDGVTAAKAGDAPAARAAIGELEFLTAALAQDLTIRVVSRPGDYSGVFRIPDDAPDARNYYLIVEAVDAKGRAQTMEISSEEDQKTARVEKWGVRVPESVFNAISADKADDQIIQHADIGAKPHGELTPSYEIDAGGAILEW
ncbi:MAG: hypothetical protein A3E78_07555 [Alphaproteobacteria bacterium RIFCSPHIGHO2_12_FULL_63_12]|nr:MAG: hypothetical protein A3E78_07555 [Alphaproteobacteria bacterium RIFCSPHIGHO2_12_FULL_63_12]